MNASHRAGPLTIVVAEADDATRHSLFFALETEGYAPRVFARGEDLLALDESYGADAYILDHHLPDMSGVELLARLRARHADAPAMFLAGRATPALRRQAAQFGAQILDKPLIGNALTAALDGILGAAAGRAGARDLDQGGPGPAR